MNNDPGNKYLLSIIVPVYNIDSELLHRSLDSVTQGKADDTQIIIVDDGSSNGAERICDEYRDTENGIYVYHQRNQGVSVARNRGLASSSGRYVMFVDSDDLIKLSNVMKIVGSADEHKLDVCFFKYRRDTDFGALPGSLAPVEMPELSQSEMIYEIAFQAEPYEGYCLGSPWGKVFRREFLEDNRLSFLPNLRKMQDRVFMMYCVRSSPKIGFIPAEGYCYIYNPGSIVNKYNPAIGKYIANVADEIIRFDDKHKTFSDEQKSNIICKLILEYIGINIFHKDNPKTYAEKRSELGDYLSAAPFKEALESYGKEGFSKNERIKLWLLRHRSYKLLFIIKSLYARRKK